MRFEFVFSKLKKIVDAVEFSQCLLNLDIVSKS